MSGQNNYGVYFWKINNVKELVKSAKKATDELEKVKEEIASLKSKLNDDDNESIKEDLQRAKNKRSKLYEDIQVDSDDFFSKKNGYRMCLRLYLNGDGAGKNTSVGAYVEVKEDKLDFIQPWPFRDNVNIQWLNQVKIKESIGETIRPSHDGHDKRSWRRPVSGERNHGVGCPLFAARFS